jgi:FtsP/CotA-like multicopper oxidase with cupredoxin domain
MSPDGVPRDMMVFNKQYPGPTIEANWGDIIEITVKNSLTTNGTSIHWHGLRQLHSVQQDGVNGITECPIAPGQSKTYTFKAVEYGSSWYHSHYTIQPGEGLVGNIKIHGPSSANYDVEAGFATLTDWWQTPLFTVFARVLRGPPLADSILVNGKGVVNGSGSYSVIELQQNKKNKLTFVNTANNAWFHVSIDQHPLTVIAVDFIPVEPFVVTSLSISAGQRYDVIIDANQEGGAFWLRTANGGGQCDGPIRKAQLGDTQGAIVRYAGSSGGNPTSQGYQMPSGCADELAGIVPVRKKNVPPPSAPPATLDLTMDTTQGVFWKVNGQAIRIDWSQPTLQYVQNGTYTLPADDNGLTLVGDGWTYWTIQNDTPLPHPIHLHGHNCKLTSLL